MLWFRLKEGLTSYLRFRRILKIAPEWKFENSLPCAEMRGSVARTAKCNEVVFGIDTAVTAKLFVVNLQIRHRPARLTSPAIATQHLATQRLVCNWIQFQAWVFWVRRIHEAFSVKPSRNACLCSSGRNLKNLVIENSNISGSPWSILAPARMSAQIISRQ